MPFSDGRHWNFRREPQETCRVCIGLPFKIGQKKIVYFFKRAILSCKKIDTEQTAPGGRKDPTTEAGPPRATNPGTYRANCVKQG